MLSVFILSALSWSSNCNESPLIQMFIVTEYRRAHSKCFKYLQMEKMSVSRNAKRNGKLNVKYDNCSHSKALFQPTQDILKMKWLCVCVCLYQVMQVVREQITRALAMKPSSLDQLKNKLRGLNYSEILRLRQSERMSQDDFQSPPIMSVWVWDSSVLWKFNAGNVKISLSAQFVAADRSHSALPLYTAVNSLGECVCPRRWCCVCAAASCGREFSRRSWSSSSSSDSTGCVREAVSENWGIAAGRVLILSLKFFVFFFLLNLLLILLILSWDFCPPSSFFSPFPPSEKFWFCRLSLNHKVLHYGDLDESPQGEVPFELLSDKSKTLGKCYSSVWLRATANKHLITRTVMLRRWPTRELIYS